MASAGQILAGRVAVSIGGDDAGLQRALANARQRLEAFARRTAAIGAGLTAAGAGILAPLGAAAREFAKAGDDVAKMARRIGVAVESLGRLGHAATLSGSNVQTLEKGLRGMARGIYDAQQGLGTALPAFEELGVDVARLASMDPETQFLTIADAITRIDSPTKKAAVAMKVFGKSGTDLIPLMDSGAVAIKAMGDEAEALNIVFSSQGAAAAERLTDEMTRLEMSLKGVVLQVGQALAPSMSYVVSLITEYVKAAGKWISENQELVVTVAGVGVVLMGVGTAFLAAAGAAAGLSAILAGMAAVFSPIGITIMAVAGGVLYLAGAFDGLGATASKLVKWIGNIRVAGLRLNTRFEEWKMGWADVFDSVLLAGVDMFKGLMLWAQKFIHELAAIGGQGSRLHEMLFGEDRVREALYQADIADLDLVRRTGGHVSQEDRQKAYDVTYRNALLSGGSTFTDLANEASTLTRGIDERKRRRQEDRIRNRIADQTGPDSSMADVYEALGIPKVNLPDAPDLSRFGKGFGAGAGAAGMPGVATPDQILGTFSARGAAGLSGGGTRVEQQQLETQRSMRDLLKRIASNTDGEAGMVLQ